MKFLFSSSIFLDFFSPHEFPSFNYVFPSRISFELLGPFDGPRSLTVFSNCCHVVQIFPLFAYPPFPILLTLTSLFFTMADFPDVSNLLPSLEP